MLLAHKIRIYPNKKQAGHLQETCNVARFAYNWALARWNMHYELGLKTSFNQLDKDFNKCKKSIIPWTYRVTKSASQHSIKSNLKEAFSRFFKKQAKYPRFKKKGIKNSFYLANDQIKLEDRYIKIPKIEKIKLSESLRFKGKIMSAVVSKTADNWFISITVDMGDVKLKKAKGYVGLDLGIKTAIVSSKGDFWDSPKPLKKYSDKLKRLSKSFSRKKKGSNNKNKARLKLANLHYKITNIRKDWIHKITSKISKENQFVFMEDLATSNMIKNHKLAKAISDMGWYEIYRQLDYKTKLRLGSVVKIDRYYPSSKTCSKCGNIKTDLKLSDRLYVCSCGVSIDRDLNAAINISTVGSTGFQACGDGSSGSYACDKNETTVREAGIIHQSLTRLNKK